MMQPGSNTLIRKKKQLGKKKKQRRKSLNKTHGTKGRRYPAILLVLKHFAPSSMYSKLISRYNLPTFNNCII